VHTFQIGNGIFPQIGPDVQKVKNIAFVLYFWDFGEEPNK